MSLKTLSNRYQKDWADIQNYTAESAKQAEVCTCFVFVCACKLFALIFVFIEKATDTLFANENFIEKHCMGKGTESRKKGVASMKHLLHKGDK